ncbi:hypothetical protein QJS66_18200 [Kocuria rhizophila]|nr:hypothetical protein QJS66_18200 [Kocuria rhizophila]
MSPSGPRPAGRGRALRAELERGGRPRHVGGTVQDAARTFVDRAPPTPWEEITSGSPSTRSIVWPARSLPARRPRPAGRAADAGIPAAIVTNALTVIARHIARGRPGGAHADRSDDDVTRCEPDPSCTCAARSCSAVAAQLRGRGEESDRASALRRPRA